MPSWSPSDPWPSGTAGGVAAPAWGGYVRLWVRAGIAPGKPWKMGPDPNDRLSAGNVLAGGEIDPGGGFLGDRLWVDLSCDVLDVELAGGAPAGQGMFGKVDAATATIRLTDPGGIYDPLWSGGPFSYGGRSRLVPGAPVQAFAETVNPADGSWQRFPLFTGTADSWAQDWVPHAWQRETILIATDATKVWTRYNTPEQPPVGGGETVGARIHRLVTYFGWPGIVDDPPGGSSRTLAATTLAQPGWELLNRAIDDELGAAYFTPAGHLRWLNRETNTTADPARVALGCVGVDPAARAVLVDAGPQKYDLALRNDVNAAISGGISQHAISSASVKQFGPYPYDRTDLGLATDVQAATWATFVVQTYAFPQIGIDNVTILPAVDDASWSLWPTMLDWRLFTDIAHLAWAPPDLPEHVIAGDVRVVGAAHTISRHEWRIVWQTVAIRPLNVSGIVWTLGPDANDRLDAGFVLA